MPPRIDPAEAAKIHALLERCRVQGRDPVQALDERGLLLYDQVRRDLFVGALQTLATMLNARSVDAIAKTLGLSPVPATAHATKSMVEAWIRHVMEGLGS